MAEGGAPTQAPAAQEKAKKQAEPAVATSETEFWAADSAAAIGGLYGIPNAVFAAAASSPNDLDGLLGGLDRRRSRALAMQLQRSVGNRAAAGLFPPLAVQRCGAEVHEGCPCAKGLQTTMNSMPLTPTLQRQDPQHTATDELKSDSPYRRLPGPLLAVMQKSYRDRTMLFGHNDQESIDDVLDRIGTAGLNGLVKIYSRAGAVWSFVDTIVWTWITDNWGMSFKSTGDIGSTLKVAPNFCKDSALGQIYHSGSECWREMTDGGAGLHVCLGAEQSMHVDPHMPVKRKGGGSTGTGALEGAAIGILFGPIGIIAGAAVGAAVGTATGGGSSELGDICVYDAQLWLQHASDVLSGKTGPDLFSRVDSARSNLDWLAKRIDFLPPSKDKTRLAARVAADKELFQKVLAAARSAASRPISGNQPLDQQVGQSTVEIEPHVPELETVEADITAMTTQVDALAAATAPPLAGGASQPPGPPPPPPPTTGQQNKAVPDVPVQRQPPTVTLGPPPKYPPPPNSALHAIPHEGKQLVENWQDMEKLLESMTAEKGWSETESWAMRFINRDPLQDPITYDKDFVSRVRNRLRTETTQMERKVKGFLDDFEHWAVDDTKELLKNSEKQLNAEAEHYGLKVSGRWFKDYSMKESERGGLQSAARELAAKRRETNRAAQVFLKMQQEWERDKKISPFVPELNAPLDAKRKEWIDLEEAYHALANDKQKTYPILAAYTTVDDAPLQLDKIANATNEALAENLKKTLADKLENIQTVREQIGDRYSIWKTPQIIALTKKTSKANEWQQRAVNDHAIEVKVAEQDNAKIFAAIAIGLGLLAAIPTGGTSVLAGVAAAGAALGAAYSLYNLYEHYKDYQLASAETGTALEKAQAISQDDPSLLWLASDLIDLGLNLVGAATAFKTLREAMLAAEVSKLQKLPGLIEQCELVGLKAEARAKVIAYVVERGGGAERVQQALKEILEGFEHALPTRDAALAKAYREAAQTITQQGRFGVYTGSGKEGIAEIERVLRNAGVDEAKISPYAKEIAEEFRTGTHNGIYYQNLDVIFLREGATADILAHELAHRAQQVGGQLETLGTMRAEFQAYHAQREFLLMLPTDKVPAGSEWLLRATNEDIKLHVLTHYQSRLLGDLKAGKLSPLDEEADSQMIIDLFKIVTKRNLM